MDYTHYQQSRDLSWKILLQSKAEALPIKITDICKAYNVPVASYKSARKFLAKHNLLCLCEDKDGFTLCRDGKCRIFFNSVCSPQRSRFTIAHELGHILLGHLSKSQKAIYAYTTINREPTPGDLPEEMQANIFASRLLAPACVLWGLNVKRAEDIMRFCDISYQSAHFRMKRMEELYKREQEFQHKKGYSCFLLSDIERQVFEQFQPYIEANRL